MTSLLYSHSLSPAIAQQHFTNISTSLSRRIEVARAKNDQQLLAQLLKEQQQLEANQALDSAAEPATPLRILHNFWTQLITAIQNAGKLHVEKIADASGEVWWYAHDPRSNKTLWANSEAEVVKWIEDNNLGQ